MATTHISLSELSPEVRASERPKAKTISELIARLKERETELGRPIVMDDDYANDMRKIIANRKPRDTSAWD
jgi:hypothetical protein